MSFRRVLAICVLLVGVGAAWYAFRPDLLFIDREAMDDTTPMAGESALSTGRFIGAAHETEGVAEIVQYADGRRVLRLRQFRTSNGPDLRVLLLASAGAAGDTTMSTASRVDLGALHGNVGDQSYELPANVVIAPNGLVTIWCRRFNVTFGSAELSVRVVGS